MIGKCFKTNEYHISIKIICLFLYQQNPVVLFRALNLLLFAEASRNSLRVALIATRRLYHIQHIKNYCDPMGKRPKRAIIS